MSEFASTHFRPKRLKILWNWNVEQKELVQVFPSSSFDRRDDRTAIITGRSVFAGPSSVSPLDLPIEVQKALLNDDAGIFSLCGCLDYELELRFKEKSVLDQTKEALDATSNYPGFVQRMLEEHANQILKRLGFNTSNDKLAASLKP